MLRSAFVRSFRVLASLPLITGLAYPLSTTANARVSGTYGRLPLYFEANKGQTHEDVRFLARGPGYSLYLTATEAVLLLAKPHTPAQQAQTEHVALRMALVGANSKSVVSGLDELQGKANYFIGKDPAKWRTNVPTYAKVRYRQVYPGIDLVYYGNQRQLEYDFVLAPGADPKQIGLGIQGADKIEIDAQGELVLHLAVGDLRLRKPFIYQEVDGIRQEIAGGYVLKDANRVGFQLAEYDTGRPLVIDPVLAYSTYLGGTGNDHGYGVAVDANGNAYVTGSTDSINFPTTAGTCQPATNGGGDVFILKLDPTGSRLVYSTYLGGSGGEAGNGIAVDADGNAHITGTTNSPDFPTATGIFQSVPGGGNDAFVTKLNPDGSSLVYSGYLGGSGNDAGSGIAVNTTGEAYLTGQTQSLNFPTTPGTFQPIVGGCSGVYPYLCDAFVTKVSASGTELVFSTYLGGDSDDAGYGIAVDVDGNAYVTGATGSLDFPTTAGTFQPAISGQEAAFVTKLNPNGTGLAYSTYLGGGGIYNVGSGIAVDASGNAYLTGRTSSSDFPTTSGAFQPALGTTASGDFTGAMDAFVTKLNPTGSALVYSTYLGGGSTDHGSSIAVDSEGSAYVTGDTDISPSPNFPTTSDAFQPAHHGGIGPGGSGTDAFFTKLNSTGTALVYSTYLGGGGNDTGFEVAADGAGNTYLVGSTNSLDFPTTLAAFQPSPGGGDYFRYPPWDAFVTKFVDVAAPPLAPLPAFPTAAR